ncbi:WD40/YVTN/BNR-like repeat-containing protein [Dictyobacter formicarum]|uniref:Photosynthesis system II assembly factor Ycf48/Hcf136-like domain-containing protein n=1 Tax=Dictyobacter formicarum TaxID=2778368 RepID=A0ABQ3VIE1_9CHLR|nr:YCF48-related protein [Dictyobacter formicarum]GHO85672.1 hypothetical protein KSZ_36780 [Dictyobacter formicarum]
MRRYALRFLPLLVLALLLLLVRSYLNQSSSYTGPSQTPQMPLAYSPFEIGPALYGVAMVSSQDVWAVGGSFKAVSNQRNTLRMVVPEQGQILHYQDDSWVAYASFPVPLLAISMSSAHDGWAVGYAGQLAHFDGHNWQAERASTSATLCSVVMLSEQEGWASGYGGTILHYHDHHWQVVASPTNNDVLSLKMLSTQEGWAVGENGTILHYSQGIWRNFASPTSHTLNDLSMLSADEGWAVGNQGIILHYRQGIWSPVQMSSPGNDTPALLGVVMNTVHSGWIIGKQSMLTYDREVWQFPSASLDGVPPALYALAMHTPNEGWAVGERNVIYHYQSGHWKIVYTQ